MWLGKHDPALESPCLHHPIGGPGVKTYTSCSHSCHFTATTCFEAFSTPISKPNVDAMAVTPLFSKQPPNSKATLPLIKDTPGFPVARQQMEQRTPHTLQGCAPISAWN